MYEDASWKQEYNRRMWQQQAQDDLNGPVVWKDEQAAADLFEQEMAEKPDPALAELDKHMSETWDKLAPLYE